jgi:hypothetical protein
MDLSPAQICPGCKVRRPAVNFPTNRAGKHYKTCTRCQVNKDTRSFLSSLASVDSWYRNPRDGSLFKNSIRILSRGHAPAVNGLLRLRLLALHGPQSVRESIRTSRVSSKTRYGPCAQLRWQRREKREQEYNKKQLRETRSIVLLALSLDLISYKSHILLKSSVTNASSARPYTLLTNRFFCTSNFRRVTYKGTAN